MKELLQKWSELEPDRCSKGRDVTFGPVFRVHGWIMFNQSLQNEDLTPKDGSILQGAVQEAIEAREGFRWHVGLGGETIHWWYAQIDKDGKTIGSWEAESKNSPAEALLSAYLQALESPQDKSEGAG